MITHGFANLGLPMSLRTLLTVLELGSVILYAIPTTAIIGAILITGYMGGAICTHLRIGEAVWLQTLVPIVGWLGLWLREPRLKSILPARK